MLTLVRAAGKYQAMVQDDRSRVRRAIEAWGRALGVRGQQDVMLELERATAEMRDQVERLQLESTPRLRPVRARPPRP